MISENIPIIKNRYSFGDESALVGGFLPEKLSIVFITLPGFIRAILNPKKCFSFRLAGIALIAWLPVTSVAQVGANDLLELSLEDLLNVEISISSVSRREQLLSETSAAIYVLTAEDISNSPALNLPDLLRAVPGVEVAQLDSNKWAISARGFNSRITSRMLLVVDGRTIYGSTYGTVFWEAEGLALQDIARIEVIRGPGANIWGANAVNGVVSITTKTPEATIGNTLLLSGGTHTRYNNYFRHSGVAGDASYYKVYGTVKEVGSFSTPQGNSANDDWDYKQVGFEFDTRLTESDKLFFRGEIFDQNIQQYKDGAWTIGDFISDIDDDITQKGRNFQTRWEHLGSNESVFVTQFYYDYLARKDGGDDKLTTYDLDFIYNNSPATRHSITIGAGFRKIKHNSTPTDYIRFVPDDRTTNVSNISIRDDYRIDHKTIISAGLKVEKNAFTGTEYMGNLSINYALTDNQNVWAAISRSVKTPSRGEVDVVFVADRLDAASEPGLFADLYVQVEPSEDFESEYLNSIEVGWRLAETRGLTLDIATFYNKYTDIRGVIQGAVYCAPDTLCSLPIDYLVVPLSANNNGHADTYGAEVLIKWQPFSSFSLESSYSYFDIDFTADLGPSDLDLDAGPINEGNTPKKDNPLGKFIFQGNWALNTAMNLNILYRYVSKPGFADISAYQAFDVKFRWQLDSGPTVSVTGRNLGGGDHLEFEEVLIGSDPALIEKSYHVGVEWNW